MDKIIVANIVDVELNDIYPCEIHISDGYIEEVIPIATTDPNDVDLDYEGILLPGFIDAHTHIESTMLIPSNYAKAVIPHGTTSVISDIHEMANISGLKGINFMIENGKEVPFDFFYAAPSCVPPTNFETSGAIIDSELVNILLKLNDFVSLGEMMNFPAVLAGDEEVLKKIEYAKKLNMPIDGHGPLLTGEKLKKYIDADIYTDHESSLFDEAIEKKKLGMKIMVREGSAVKNFDDLLNKNDRQIFWANEEDAKNLSRDDYNLLLKNPIFDFLVSDDKNPIDILNGHLNLLIKRLIDTDVFPIEAIKMVTLNPSKHYNLDVGVIAAGKKANFVLIDNFDNFNILKTFVGGEIVYEDGNVLFDSEDVEFENTFNVSEKSPEDFDVKIDLKEGKIKALIMKVMDKSLITDKTIKELEVKDHIIQENIDRDILKIAVVNRYGEDTVTNGFVKGFKITDGALASSIAHDCHNIIVVGTNKHDMAKAVNEIIENQGGLAVVSRRNDIKESLELPIAGLMCNDDVSTLALKLKNLQNIVKLLGCEFNSPFMTLSFLSLLVIPSIKISDKGLFDSEEFRFTDIVQEVISEDEENA
ncbi:adenine deaminase [uncultured Methanobrevibacter sp.]|uniref:adenine deaminase n=1 Tax=uncultured Methanobrevibacter sp. TaxID=253161 RepID=UPI0025CDCB40|nr:adenine deaminase [uncultured Methanobrevibacter sp.]